MNPLLTINTISKYYKGICALDKVSIDVEKGAIYGIVGPNGSGKTTLLSIISGVKAQTSGAINTNSVRIGALIEAPIFYDYMTAIQNLRLIAHLRDDKDSDLLKILQIVRLEKQCNKKFRDFSLGMKQRLGIAGTLIGKPDLIILDEPTNGLDPLGIIEIRDIILELQANGITLLIASHLLFEIEKICTHIIVMKEGKLLYKGSMEEFLINHIKAEDALISILKI